MFVQIINILPYQTHTADKQRISGEIKVEHVNHVATPSLSFSRKLSARKRSWEFESCGFSFSPLLMRMTFEPKWGPRVDCPPWSRFGLAWLTSGGSCCCTWPRADLAVRHFSSKAMAIQDGCWFCELNCCWSLTGCLSASCWSCYLMLALPVADY